MGSVDFSKLPAFQAKTTRAVNAGLTACARTASVFVKRGMSKGARHTPSAPGTPPNVQRGILRNGIGYEPSTNLRSTVGVAAAVKYARIQEFGGKITATRAKYLTVPVNQEAKRASEIGTPIRSLNLRLAFGKGGMYLVPAQTTKRRSRARQRGPVFALKRSVRIPARPYLRPGVYNNIREIANSGYAEARRVLRAST